MAAETATTRYQNSLTLLGIIEPAPWDYDGGKRREPVLDTDQIPPRVVRRVGWHRCLRCVSRSSASMWQPCASATIAGATRTDSCRANTIARRFHLTCRAKG